MSESLPEQVRAYMARHPEVSIETCAFYFNDMPPSLVRVYLGRRAQGAKVTPQKIERAKKLRSQGKSYEAIGCEIGLHKETVRRHLTEAA